MSKIRSDKRLEKAEQRRKTIYLVVTIVLVLTFIGLGIYSYIAGHSSGDDVVYETQDTQADMVLIPVNSINDGRFHYYSKNVDGVDVKYFLVSDDDGNIHTAFNACDVCYKSKRGYSQDGDTAKCGNCGQRFSIDDLGTKNTAGGGCWPGYLHHIKDGNDIMIKNADLSRGKYYFK